MRRRLLRKCQGLCDGMSHKRGGILSAMPSDQARSPGLDLVLPALPMSVVQHASEPEPERPPWERLPEETPRAWAAFARYRDAGPTRSMAKVAAAEGLAPSTRRHLARWASRYRW